MTEKDIYSNGVALLEEWEDVNYCEHSFKFKDEWLTDKEVVDLLNELDEKYVDEFALRETLQQELQRSEEENEQLKIRFNEEREKSLKFCRNIDTLTIENEQLKSEIEKLSYANEDLLEEKRIWKQMSDEYTKLSDENEQLKAYKQKVAKVFKVAIKETTLTEQTENSLQTISKILEVDLE